MPPPSWPWRLCFALSAAAFMIGGPMHPPGAGPEDLAHPDWVPSHALMLVGLLALLTGLVLYRRRGSLPDRTARWSRLAVFATGVMAVEMALHTAAALDAERAAAGAATPILTTHLWMAILFYPVFGLVTAGFVLATAGDRSVASPWVAPLGLIGALGFGFAPPAVVVLGERWAFLFVFLLPLALWILMAGIWPTPRKEAAPSTA